MKAVPELLEDLTLEEKIALVSGHDFMYTNPIARLDIPSIRMSDGPHGLRVQNGNGDNGVSGSEVATCFPPASLSACSWNEELLRKEGEAIGEEANHYNIDVVLGPGANIKRNPLGGRNFEYFSEDPYLSGKMAASLIKGIQSKGVSSSLKHFATNNQENFRFMGDSLIDKRALNEIYLKSFEIAIKEGRPDTLMSSYNKINGDYCSQNKELLTDTLRSNWGFDGLVMTDWGGTHDRVKMLQSGLDLEMPGDTDICRKWIYDAIKNGTLKEETLDKAVSDVLNLVNKHSEKKPFKADFAKHAKLSLEIALDSAILLKNDGLLPLDHNRKYMVVGDLFSKMRYQGSGSSMINSYKLVTPKEAFDKANIQYEFFQGYKENKKDVDESLLKEIDENIDSFDAVVAFIGLTDYQESEGADRESYRLPANQIALIDHIANKGKKVVLVLFGGSPFEIPRLSEANSILNMYLPGEEGGEACKRLLFGENNPSGKLAESWPKTYKDVYRGDKFSKSRIEEYREGIYLGYRYYQKAKKEVAFPFGYGLSYTKFEYNDLKVEEKEKEIDISLKVKNIGKRKGAEIVQIYVKGPSSDIPKPVKELKGFAKVYLEPNEEKEVNIILKKDDLRYFNIKENRFVLEKGSYTIEASSSADKVELAETLLLEGESLKDIYPDNILEISDDGFERLIGYKIPKPKLKPITLESRFSDLKETFLGKILYSAVLSVAKKDMKKAKKMDEGPSKDNKIKGALFLYRILDSNSLLTMSMSAGRQFTYPLAMMMMHLANGHIFKGLNCLFKKVDAPELPNSKEKKQ